MSAIKHRPHRNKGKASPLDRLPATVGEQLRRRFLGAETLRKIKEWLATEHQCKTSTTSLSDWWIRQSEEERQQRAALTLPADGCEIRVVAPGGSEIRVRVLPMGGLRQAEISQSEK